MFVQITNGKNWEKNRTPSPNKCASPFSEQGGEMEYEHSGVINIKEHDSTCTSINMKHIEQAPDSGTSLPTVITESPPLTTVHIIDSSLANEKSPTNTKDGSHIFGRITERAAKYLPKKSNFGKIFGEKETDIRISTIDREMTRQNNPQKLRPQHSYKAEFSNSELTDRLRKTKQPVGIDENSSRSKTTGCLAVDYPPYRLFFLPAEDWRDPDSLLTTLVRVTLCQLVLITFLLLWLMFGALVFHLTEGPHEYNTAVESEREERSLVVALATDLRLLNQEDATWKETIEKYTGQHREIVMKSMELNYGKQKYFWTYPGSFLFATSLLTTFGAAAPLPSTNAGKIGAFIFIILGFPMHLFLLINMGRTIALKVQIVAKQLEIKMYELRRRVRNVRKFGEDLGKEKENWPEKMFLEEFKPPAWLCHLPILTILLYYLFGSLLFGLGEDIPNLFLFPINFSNNNYHSTEIARFGYACYLEGLAILIFINIAIWRDSPYEGLSCIGRNLRFMTNEMFD